MSLCSQYQQRTTIGFGYFFFVRQVTSSKLGHPLSNLCSGNWTLVKLCEDSSLQGNNKINMIE